MDPATTTPQYEPDRNRWMVDYFAGFGVGILGGLIAAAIAGASVQDGYGETEALVLALVIGWPLGAIVGVWISARPRTTASFAWSALLTIVGAGVLLLPFWLDAESDTLRGFFGFLALVISPALARWGIDIHRRRNRRESLTERTIESPA